MEQKKFTEDDYYKLVATLWDIDAWLLQEKDFNPKWETICKALEIKPRYTDEHKTGLDDKTVKRITEALYHKRHFYQQYVEASENSKKTSEKIMDESYMP